MENFKAVVLLIEVSYNSDKIVNFTILESSKYFKAIQNSRKNRESISSKYFNFFENARDIFAYKDI